MGLEIGAVIIPWYGLFIVLGIAAGMILGFFLIRINHMKFDDFIQIVCFVGLGGNDRGETSISRCIVEKY